MVNILSQLYNMASVLMENIGSYFTSFDCILYSFVQILLEDSEFLNSLTDELPPQGMELLDSILD